jgi:glutathione S-transferase
VRGCAKISHPTVTRRKVLWNPPAEVRVKLYYVPNTRSNRPRWMLEELEVPYELVRLDPKQGDNKTREYLAINPTGKVPSLVDGEVTMFESAAIVAYLGDKFADKKLAPPVGSNDRAAYYQWLFFGMTTLEQPLSLYTSHTVSLAPEKRVAHVADEAKEAEDRALAALESSLADRDWLLGRFTARTSSSAVASSGQAR